MLGAVSTVALATTTITAPQALAEPSQPVAVHTAERPGAIPQDIQPILGIVGLLAIIGILIGAASGSSGGTQTPDKKDPTPTPKDSGGTPASSPKADPPPTPDPPAGDDDTAPRSGIDLIDDDVDPENNDGQTSGKEPKPPAQGSDRTVGGDDDDSDDTTTDDDADDYREYRDTIYNDIHAERRKAKVRKADPDDVIQYYAQRDARLIGQKVAQRGDDGFRPINVKNWISGEKIRQQPWWRNRYHEVDSVYWRSQESDAAEKFIRSAMTDNGATITDDRFAHVGAGAWQDPDTKEWFFVVHFMSR